VLKRVLDCLDQTEADGWEYVTTSKGVTVHRKILPGLDGKMTNYCCVKVRKRGQGRDGMGGGVRGVNGGIFEGVCRLSKGLTFWVQGA
jgi:hypothetical protein